MVTILNLLIGTIVVSMFVGGMAAFVDDVDYTYGLNLNESNFEFLDTIKNTTDLATQQAEEIAQAEITESDFITTIVKGVFTAGKLVITAPVNAGQIIGDMLLPGFASLSILGIPVVFQNGLIGIITLLIAFGLMYAIFKIRF